MRLAIFVALIALQSNALPAQDTVRVRADGPPVWGRDVKLVQELAIGQVDGPPEYAFGRIFFAAAEHGGAFYLFDGNDGQVRRYDARGRFTGLIGRKGSGPGEYQTVGNMAVDASGLLVVFDPASRRVTHFGPDGKMRREWSTTRSLWNDFHIDSAGRLYFRSSVAGAFEGPGARFQYVRHASDGRVLDSLSIPQLVSPLPAYRSFYTVTSDGGRPNFTIENIVAPNLAGGLVAASSDAYRVIVNDGLRSRVIERKADPVPLGREEREQWLEWADSTRVRGGSRAQYEIPRVKPLIRGLRTDLQGRLWVEVYVAAERRTHLPATRANGGKQILYWRERTTFDVFSPGGQYLGRVALPQQSILLTISGNRLYVLGKGPDDEDRLLVLRLDIPQ
jgi:sugar lactone lactonase YvrE